MSSYSLGLSLFNGLARVPVLSNGLTAFARIWLRHARWRLHLRRFQFDEVIDGGANIGEFAQIVRATLPNARLLCVEPHPECAAALRKKGFEVVEAALWSEQAMLDLSEPGPSTSSTVMAAKPGGRSFKVSAVRLGDLPVQGRRVLIKLDLQGAELAALSALGNLEERCAAFLVETSLPPSGNDEALRQFFSTRGYVEFASVNELFDGDRQVEADLLWVKRDLL